MRMEALYSKLHDKYIKLKARKETEVEHINREQEIKFMDYQSAADELIEHLRNENHKLHSQIIDLSSSKAEQHVKPTKKHDSLSQEIDKLQDLQNESREVRTEIRQSTVSGSDQVVLYKRKLRKRRTEVESDTGDILNSNSSAKRSRHYEAAKNVMLTPSTSGHLPIAILRSDELTQPALSGSQVNISQPVCCRRKVDPSGNGLSASCFFLDLIERSLGMKLTAATQENGISISAFHQSSGYSFKLTYPEKVGNEMEITYHVLSLGTFERVAPEWMKEMIIFSMAMLPIFFARVLRVIKHQQ